MSASVNRRKKSKILDEPNEPIQGTDAGSTAAGAGSAAAAAGSPPRAAGRAHPWWACRSAAAAVRYCLWTRCRSVCRGRSRTRSVRRIRIHLRSVRGSRIHRCSVRRSRIRRSVCHDFQAMARYASCCLRFTAWHWWPASRLHRVSPPHPRHLDRRTEGGAVPCQEGGRERSLRRAEEESLTLWRTSTRR